MIIDNSNIYQEYDRKCVSALYAARQLDDVKNLILGMSVAMPPGLLTAVAAALKNNDIPPLSIYYMHGSEVLKNTLLSPEMKSMVTPHPIFMSAHDREAIKRMGVPNGMQFIPATFHQVGRMLTEHISPDCFMVTVSRMDKHGYFSLGTNADYGASVIRKAKKIIVEVNEHMPRTFGECTVHISEVDYLIENNQPLMESHPQRTSETDLKIATQIAGYIQDGDTLQMGIGGVPNSVLGLLGEHKNLGLHSELFSPAIAKLIQQGVITGKKKSWMQHKHVFTLAIGNRAMYDFMDDNPSVVGYPASWVNNPNIIRKNKNMVSVNAAIEVDLAGQINAEQLNGQTFSGTGGQLDFVRGAYAAENGRSFIALHSTAKRGSISRIVPKLKGSAVTDTRMDTHYVVTEYGSVNLKGKSLPERARALILLAHPQFRDELSQQARELGWL
ncbi:acetyl-CoA hydrolase/transferase family protein [Alkalimarinus coralli]|uniref:acetyl-CoA hydrolase/transferase family protein n=1 Tax=Alkalimarinus coralli TaxID=2935863 RepID=UPI00202B480A|nr:acetyl-CoA hydrolase/transferase C-terminal domain-containing protein [Alkalimarinus coralli]